MAPTPEIAKAIASASALRGHLTRKVRVLRSAMEFAEGSPSHRAAQDVEAKITAVREQMDKAEQA